MLVLITNKNAEEASISMEDKICFVMPAATGGVVILIRFYITERREFQQSGISEYPSWAEWGAGQSQGEGR